MRWISRLLFLAIVLYVVLPYYSLYRLEHALVIDDVEQISHFIDLEQVRKNYKLGLRIREGEGREGVVKQLFRGTANAMSEMTVDQLVSLNWVRKQLVAAESGQVGQSMFASLDHAFFEFPNQFMVRLGTLENNPTHLIFVREDWVWRLVAIHH